MSCLSKVGSRPGGSNLMTCETCNKEHDGKYGSGRFCSVKCARSFSTSINREEINMKISKGNVAWYKTEKGQDYLLKRKNEAKTMRRTRTKERIILYKKEFTCQICGNKYLSFEENSSTCGTKICGNQILSIKRINAIRNGKVNNSKRYIFNFKDKRILCDSKIEYAALDYFIKNYKIIDMGRCDIIIKYFFNNNIKRFLPDFIIITDKEKYIVECKSFISIKTLNKKWHFYNETAPFKKIALEKYCLENNYKSFWFNKNMHRKFYNEVKVESLLVQPLASSTIR